MNPFSSLALLAFASSFCGAYAQDPLPEATKPGITKREMTKVQSGSLSKKPSRNGTPNQKPLPSPGDTPQSSVVENDELPTPGIYVTEPYKCIVVVPGGIADKLS